MTKTKIRVMLVDDHAVVRVGFRMLLSLNPDIEVVGEAENGEQAYHHYPEIRPDVVIMDLSMPGMGGIETVRRLVARDSDARVLVLSAHEDTAHPKRVLKAGALGYLCKRSAPEELIDAVTAISGSGPAYIFFVVESMIEAGVHLGLPRSTATDLVVQTLVGSAAMLRETGTHPVVLREQVTSPSGTTASALRELEVHRVRAAFLAAMEAARNRSRELAEGS